VASVVSAREDLRKAWRGARTSPSFYALVATNLLPLIGIVFLRWRADTAILFYLVESVVTTLVTTKMLAFVAEDRDLPEDLSRPFLLVAGVSIIAMGAFWGYLFGWFRYAQVDASSILAFLLSAAFMAATHVHSYLHNFIGRKEYERMPIRAMQVRGWGGVFLGTLIAGFLFPLLMWFGSIVPFVAILIAVKTFAAVSGFIEDRARAEGSTATSITYTQPTARCPRCHRILRTDNAKQCFHCGADWHQGAVSGTPTRRTP